MAKRSNDFLPNTKNVKKQKLNDADETLWDDDLDDYCFDEIANKILEKDDIVQATQQNSSVLLSYDSFKPNIPFASTQQISAPSNDFKMPHPIVNTEELKMKLTYLQQKCEAKEGEVSILRSQMKKMKTEMAEEQSKKQKEHLEITNLKEKQIKSIKGQLDFKDLEIANLRQKIMEMSKTNISNTFEQSKRQKIDSPSRSVLSCTKENASKIIKGVEEDFETNIILEPDYIVPMRQFSNFFESSTHEIHVVETRISQFGRNTIPYLHNQLIQEELTIPPGPKVSAQIHNAEVFLEDIYSDVFQLFNCNVDENNAEDKKAIINKFLGVSIELLKNFKLYLEQLENIYRTEDIEQLDRIFLQNNSKDCDISKEKNDSTYEIGKRAGKTLNVIENLLPYNEYIKDLLISHPRHDLVFTNFEYLKDLQKKDFYFLLLNDIVRKIFSLRKTEVCTTFLNSVASLLLVLSKEKLYDNIFSAFTSLYGSLLYTRPRQDVLYKLLVTMTNCSKSKAFLDFLCQKPNCKKFTVDKKRKLTYFSEDTCKFTLFVALLNNTFKDIKEEILFIKVTYSVLSFVDNIFTSNPYWVHDQQINQCTCLEKLYQLIIEVLYWTFLNYKRNKQNKYKNKYISIFKCGIRVFELLFFNSYDFLEKFVETYSRFKEICKSFLEFEDQDFAEETLSLDKLCLFEEVPVVPSSSFELI